MSFSTSTQLWMFLAGHHDMLLLYEFLLWNMLSELKNPTDTPSDICLHCTIPFLVQQPRVFNGTKLQMKIKKKKKGIGKEIFEDLSYFN